MNNNLTISDEPLDFFVWINPNDRFIQHQVGLVGSFTSAPFVDPKAALMFIPNPNFKSGITSFQNNLLRNYMAEYNLEVDRLRWFPKYPSRLHSIFLFGAENEANNYSIKHPEHVGDRILKRVKTVGPYTYSKHDSSWVNFLRLPHSIDVSSINNISKSYWKGIKAEQCELTSFGKPWTESTVMEILFLGRVDFYDKTVNTEHDA
jgi:hypothetical protein